MFFQMIFYVFLTSESSLGRLLLLKKTLSVNLFHDEYLERCWLDKVNKAFIFCGTSWHTSDGLVGAVHL